MAQSRGELFTKTETLEQLQNAQSATSFGVNRDNPFIFCSKRSQIKILSYFQGTTFSPKWDYVLC
jgi:hypothetical protein